MIALVTTTVVCVIASKETVRAEVSAARKRLDPHTRAQANAAIISHLLPLVAGKNVAAYAPLPLEPGGDELLPRLAAVARSVWLPLSRPAGKLLWARYSGADGLVPGALGIAEPTGPTCSSAVLATLDLILTPALAADTAGRRLGKGAGYYDRALAGISTPTAVLLYAGEIVPSVGAQPHDAAMTMAITPNGVEPF